MSLYRQIFKGSGVAAREIEYPSVFDVVATIKQCGGYAVLAHPGQFNTYPYVGDLVEAGLDGIEKYHHTHNQKDRDTVDELARTYGIFTSAGTDFHGIYESPQRIDQELADETQVPILLDKLF